MKKVVLEISRMVWTMKLYIYIYIYIDKAGLEDLITFHEAECDTIDGCYLVVAGIIKLIM